MRSLLIALMLVGCGTSATEDEPSRRSVYLDSLCRMYVEDTCVTSQDDSCGGSISFDTIADCGAFFRFALSQCDGVTEALEDNADVESCITALDAYDCATEPVCDSEGTLIAGGAACLATDELIQSLCPDDDSGL